MGADEVGSWNPVGDRVNATAICAMSYRFSSTQALVRPTFHRVDYCRAGPPSSPCSTFHAAMISR